jgi:hypothetical protein
MPVVCSVSFLRENVVRQENTYRKETIDKFVWKKENAQRFNDALTTEKAHLMLENAIGLIDIDSDVAVNVFNDCIREVAACMKKTSECEWTKEKARLV